MGIASKLLELSGLLLAELPLRLPLWVHPRHGRQIVFVQYFELNQRIVMAPFCAGWAFSWWPG